MSVPVSNGKIALVTGVNGYIASVLGFQLLSKGYTLRGTVRSASSGEALIHGAYSAFTSRVEIVEISDITQRGAFDQAVKGVHLIFHVASPVNFTLTDASQVIDVAVESTIGVLHSAKLHGGPQLEAMVMTSSIAAVMDMEKPSNYKFTETDWNDFSEKMVRDQSGQVPSFMLYLASKAASEKAVWKFRDEHKPNFSISAVLPGVALGPPVQPSSKPSSMNESLRPTWALFSGEAKTTEDTVGVPSFVDVRDIGRIEIWCAEHPQQSNGQRYIASAGYGGPQAIADTLRKAYPNRLDKIPKGEPGVGYNPDYSHREDRFSYRGEKAEKTVGMKYIRFDQMVLDTAKAFERYL